MSWQVGQKLVCVRESVSSNSAVEQLLMGYVKEQEKGWVTVVCPTARVIVSRYQEQFEKDGWQLDQRDRVPTVAYQEALAAK